MRSECYNFRVADKEYSIQYLRMTYLEGYDNAQLARLAASRAFEITYRLEDYTLPNESVATCSVSASARGSAPVKTRTSNLLIRNLRMTFCRL